MLRMKKDMGGAAVALGITRLVMEADLPIRLSDPYWLRQKTPCPARRCVHRISFARGPA